MSEIFVDVEALLALRDRLVAVYEALDHAKDDINAFDADLGSSKIENALDSFVSSWRDGRKKIKTGIEGMVARIDSAIDAYVGVEADLAKQADDAAASIAPSTVSVSRGG
jgi:hypothetical protein